MKSIFIYFSYSGNNDYLASELKKKINCDVLKLETVEEYTKSTFKVIFKGGMESIRGAKPQLKPYTFDADKYDVIIFGTPVWALTYAPAIRTFASENTIKSGQKMIYTCTHQGNTGHTIDKFKELFAHCEAIHTVEMREPLSNKELADQALNKLVDSIKTSV